MKFTFSAANLSVAALLLLSSTGLFTTACSLDGDDSTPRVVDTTNYVRVDENIIKNYLAGANVTTAQRQASGLYYLPTRLDSSGIRATAGKTVSVLYTGLFLDGRVFDASPSRDKPITFVLGTGRVIPGWDEGIALMRKGEKAQLFIPSKLAYGPSGGGSIPPNTVLRFEVELVNVR